jgi:hypothetical protein
MSVNLGEGDVILAKESMNLRSRIRKQLSGGPVGNFLTFHFADATASSEEIGILIRAGFRDAYGEAGELPGFTWDGRKNSDIQLQKRVCPDDFWLEATGKRIDYVFYRGPVLRVTKNEVVLDLPVEGVYPYDHFGV